MMFMLIIFKLIMFMLIMFKLIMFMLMISGYRYYCKFWIKNIWNRRKYPSYFPNIFWNSMNNKLSSRRQQVLITCTILAF
jgi:hypothetical protein